MVQTSKIREDVVRLPSGLADTVQGLAGTVQGLADRADLRAIAQDVGSSRDELQRIVTDLSHRVQETSGKVGRSTGQSKKKRSQKGIGISGSLAIAGVVLLLLVVFRMRNKHNGHPPDAADGATLA